MSAYVADFGGLERLLKDHPDETCIARVADELAHRNERIWHVKATVEAQARAWLHPLPKGSIDRAYVWAVLRVYYGETVMIDRLQLQKQADDIAKQQSDEALDTPNTRIAERIRAGDLTSRDDLLETIHHEKQAVMARYRAALNLYQEVKVSAATG